MKRLTNFLLFAVFLCGTVLLSGTAHVHLNNATAAFDRIAALASR